MEKDIKSLIVEILLFIVISIIVVPIFVNASNNYNKKKSNILQYNNISIDIKYENSNMFININNYNKDEKVINLIMKTTKFSNEYLVKLDGKEYNLNDVPHSEDDNNYFFNLGSYKIAKEKNIDFSMNIIGEEIYDDSITYSFVAEVANW